MPLYSGAGAEPELPLGMLAKGNINILKRPAVKNPDGTVSSVRSITVTDNLGHAYLIPTVIKTLGGWRVVSNQLAINYWKKTGQHLGYFANEAAANRYAGVLHRQQAAMTAPRPSGRRR
jgi:hypothetical protein